MPVRAHHIIQITGGTMLLLRRGLPRQHRLLPRTRLLSTTASTDATPTCSSDVTASATSRPNEVLVRDFIHEALYSPRDGYFTTKGSNVIISPLPSERIAFASLKGYWDYQLAVDKLYKSKAQAWMTPVEIFAPHYSQAIARYILEAFAREEQAVAMVKVDGGVSPHGAQMEEDEEFFFSGSSSQDNWKRTMAATRRKRSRPLKSSEATTSHKELHIYEMGGGYGTNASCILDYLQAHAPDVYARTKYTIIEISKSLAEKQLQRLHPRHDQVCEVVQQDALEWTQQRIKQNKERPQTPATSSSFSSSSYPFILALEVLDNLPHDKVLWVEGEDGWRLREAVVRGDGSEEHPYHEAHRPLSDELIALVLRVKPELARRIDPREQIAEGSSSSGGGRELWRAMKEKVVRAVTRRPVDPPRALFVPTGMARLVEGLCRAFPRKHHFVFADFDSLPAPSFEAEEREKSRDMSSISFEKEARDLWALNAPLVTSRDSATGAHRDHPSYLLNRGGADIFFPVDFILLRDLYRFLVSSADRRGGGKGYTARVVKSSRFLARYGREGGTRTRSGYDPMVEDFLNTCFFLAERTHQAGGTHGVSSSKPET
ncbi:s-adenosyl-l-methionine-dependent methyltransferase [Nannochloropsis oceanica]